MAQRNSGSFSITSALASGAIRAIAFHVTTTYLLPIGAPLIAGYLGYVQGLPWMYIWVGALLAFAAAAHGAVQFDQWLQRRRVADKLSFAHVRLVRDIRGTPALALGVGPLPSAARASTTECRQTEPMPCASSPCPLGGAHGLTIT